jgi:hypothetical protein
MAFGRACAQVLNMAFGCLSGLQPLLSPGTSAAYTQTSTVLSLQLGMALLCCTFLPDADRIISRFAATQFLLEGLATSALLGASASTDYASAANQTSANQTAAGAAVAPPQPSLVSDLRTSGFALSLSAMAVPMLQLIEQRVITPFIGVVRAKGGNPLALLAAAYMLWASLPTR